MRAHMRVTKKRQETCMDGRGFDDLTRRFATKRPRRAVLKGLLGLGGAAVATTVSRESGGAAWSTLVCLPDGSGDYVQRLVPTAAVPFYLSQYGAVLPENGSCPEGCQNHACGDICCEAGQNACLINGSCARTCAGSGDCPIGCGCPLSSVEGGQHCIRNGVTCEIATQLCNSTDECDPGWHCQSWLCGGQLENRCVPLCGTPI